MAAEMTLSEEEIMNFLNEATDTDEEWVTPTTRQISPVYPQNYVVENDPTLTIIESDISEVDDQKTQPENNNIVEMPEDPMIEEYIINFKSHVNQ